MKWKDGQLGNGKVVPTYACINGRKPRNASGLPITGRNSNLVPSKFPPWFYF